jgi:anti-sigma regulatory factor (Ser/Thr protein kinase)
VRIEDIEGVVKKGLRLRDLSVGSYELQNYIRHYSEVQIPNYQHLFPSVILYILKDCQWRGFDDDQMLSNLSVVLDEMLMNAFKHGNKEREDRTITIRYAFDVDKLQITIEDEGEGFDTEQVIRELTNLERHQLLERGVFLLSILMDDFQYNEKGNAVTLTMMRPMKGAEDLIEADIGEI